MAEAVILYDGRVVRTTNFDEGSLTFFKTGYLKSFKVDGKEFVSSKGKTTGKHYGYWDLDSMLRYRAKLITRSQFLNGRFKDRDFIDAVFKQEEEGVEGDTIIYEIRRLQTDLMMICFVEFRVEFTVETGFNWSAIGEGQYYPIQIEGAEMQTPICDRIPNGSTAYNFYVDYFGIPEARMPLELRADVAQIIHEMEEYIYKDFLSMHNAPPNLWEIIGQLVYTIVEGDFDNIEEFQRALNSFKLEALKEQLLEFYTNFRINRLIVEDSDDLSLRVATAMGMPFNVLINVDLDTKIDMLKHLLNNDFLSTWFERDIAEQFVIKILKSFTADNIADVDNFLEKLLETQLDGNTSVTLFQRLYDSMSKDWAITEWAYNISNWAFNTDWQPENTAGAFAKYAYYLWIVSKYNPYDYITGALKENAVGIYSKESDGTYLYDTYNSGIAGGPVLDANGDIVTSTTADPNVQFYYTKYRAYDSNLLMQEAETFHEKIQLVNANIREEAAPIHIYYESEKVFGVYKDNAQLQYDGESIKVSIDTAVSYALHPFTIVAKTPIQYGRYKIFQPVSLIDISNQDTVIPVHTTDGETITYVGNINSLIPAFMLKYIDDAGDREDIQTILGYIFEFALTLTVIGNATKLYHLRHLSKLRYAGAIIGTVDATVTSLNFLLNFVDGCNNNEFCKQLRTFLGWVELATLTADGVTGIVNTIVSRKAKRLAQQAGVTETDDLDVATQKVKQALGDTDEAIEPAVMILMFASFVNKAEEFQNFLNTIESLGYITLKNKLIDLKNLDEDIAYVFMDTLKHEDEIFEALNDTLTQFPDFFNNVNTINKADKVAGAANSFVSVNKKIKIENVDLVNPRHTPLELSIQDVEEIIEHGFNNNLPIDDIEEIIFNSARINKSYGVVEAKQRITNLMQEIRPRGYPYGINSSVVFQAFRDGSLVNILDEFNLPKNKVKMGGSSLQTSNGKDLDIYLDMSDNELLELQETITNEAKRLQDAGVFNKKQRDKPIKSIRNSLQKKGIIYAGAILKPNGNGETLLEALKQLPEFNFWPDGIEINIKTIENPSSLTYIDIDFQ